MEKNPILELKGRLLKLNSENYSFSEYRKRLDIIFVETEIRFQTEIFNAYNQGYRDAEIDVSSGNISNIDISAHEDAFNYYEKTFRHDITIHQNTNRLSNSHKNRFDNNLHDGD